jgi:hypothetical protein
VSSLEQSKKEQVAWDRRYGSYDPPVGWSLDEIPPLFFGFDIVVDVRLVFVLISFSSIKRFCMTSCGCPTRIRTPFA